MDNRNSKSTIAWLLLIVFLPIVGLIIYLFIGRNWRRVNLSKQKEKKYVLRKLEDNFKEVKKKQKDEVEKLLKKYKYQEDIIKIQKLIENNSKFHLTSNNEVKVLTDGEAKFGELLKDLKNAKKFIHLQYFIWRSDKLGNEIAQILMDKVKQGVEVRILYDSLGCLFSMKRSYKMRLRRAGIEIHGFFNLKEISNIFTLNYRNHNKIAVIDGIIGYTGGFNVGQEYIDGKPHYASWRDTHVKIIGEAAQELQIEYAIGWFETTKKLLSEKKYYPKIEVKSKREIPIQIVSSGPDSRWPAIKQVFISMIYGATKTVYWQTPYFVLDDSMISALKNSALSGVDVRVMVTGVPDKKIPYWAAFTFFEDLLEAGVKFYHYKAGFMHQKTMIVDDEICTIGTTNGDIRSFDLHYEVNAVIYDPQVTLRLREDFLNDLLNSDEMTKNKYNKISKLAKFRNSLMRLLTPLL